MLYYRAWGWVYCCWIARPSCTNQPAEWNSSLEGGRRSGSWYSLPTSKPHCTSRVFVYDLEAWYVSPRLLMMAMLRLCILKQVSRRQVQRLCAQFYPRWSSHTKFKSTVISSEFHSAFTCMYQNSTPLRKSLFVSVKMKRTCSRFVVTLYKLIWVFILYSFSGIYSASLIPLVWGGPAGIQLERYMEALHDPDANLTYTAMTGVRKQSVVDAERLFSAGLVEFMERKGYEFEAEYVRVILDWRRACDERGLSELQRCRYNYHNVMLNYMLDELMPWHDEYDFSHIEVNRYIIV